MPSARTASLHRPAGVRGKGGFAKHVSGFANRAVALPGFPYMWIACAAAAALMTVTGGFNTSDLPIVARTGFWLLLMGWNALKWQIWFALFVRKSSDWPRMSLAGAIPLNLTLPFEITLAGRAVGAAMFATPGEVWLRALAISIGIFTVCGLVGWLVHHRARPHPIAADGLLARVRIAPAELLAIEAEDHYCRVHRRGGPNMLIHYRFGDALAEVESLEGDQVHRGAWVSAAAVAGAMREGRRWELVLTDGQRVPVSATYLSRARERGWLRAGAKTCAAMAP